MAKREIIKAGNLERLKIEKQVQDNETPDMQRYFHLGEIAFDMMFCGEHNTPKLAHAIFADYDNPKYKWCVDAVFVLAGAAKFNEARASLLVTNICAGKHSQNYGLAVGVLIASGIEDTLASHIIPPLCTLLA
jgi:hypothetical protein